MSQCWPIHWLSILQKAVLISLADQANDDGVCWPSVGTICERVCASERAVQEAIRDLMEAGFVSRKWQPGKPTIYRLTPANGAPPQMAHPAASAGQGVRDLPVGGAGSADITVIEPSLEPSDTKSVEKKAKRKTKSQKIGLGEFIAACKESGESPIPSDDPIFGYLGRIGLPAEFGALAWQWFACRYADKQQSGVRGWRQAFRNAVEGNWPKYWFRSDGGEWLLTTAGKQAQIDYEATQKIKKAAA